MLTSLTTAGVVVGGVMLIMYGLMVVFSLVGAIVVFLGLFNLFRGLRCGASFWLCSHLIGVVRHVRCLLDGRHGSVPFELVRDGDLLFLIQRMLRLWGSDYQGQGSC